MRGMPIRRASRDQGMNPRSRGQEKIPPLRILVTVSGAVTLPKQYKRVSILAIGPGGQGDANTSGSWYATGGGGGGAIAIKKYRPKGVLQVTIGASTSTSGAYGTDTVVTDAGAEILRAGCGRTGRITQTSNSASSIISPGGVVSGIEGSYGFPGGDSGTGTNGGRSGGGCAGGSMSAGANGVTNSLPGGNQAMAIDSPGGRPGVPVNVNPDQTLSGQVFGGGAMANRNEGAGPGAVLVMVEF